MDLRRIRHFVVVAETLNFRRAAERLHMAQPPLTVSIQKFEAELGVKLFNRGPGGIALTPSGHAALGEARKLLFHGAQLVEVARSASEGTGGTLSIGFVGSASYGLLQRLIPVFRARYPGVELGLREMTSTRIVESVDGGELDIGIIRMPLLQDTLGCLVPLEEDRFVLAIPCSNALAKQSSVTLASLSEERFVMYASGQAMGLRAAAMLACQRAGFVPRITQEAVQIQTLLSLVESGLGVALVPSVMERFQSPRIVYRHLADPPETAQIGLSLLYRPDRESVAAHNFRMVACRVLQPASSNVTPR
ncbi:LysR family transcriptional regulator [Bordetella trematum]|uniref:LysR family transcriptional regulator n=1 Tax=Bordetella trematum TaxID=123899 RepID=UPI00046F8522|nr:LysR family transcriptional regulator [Bordetella trematum]AUL48854.1 LysR family transcriptional regulator [Bordetella trematum]QIM70775.1 LysR family transcriptional regulator [Bordetella trematum]